MRVGERIIIKPENVKGTEFEGLDRADVYLLEIVDGKTAIIQWFKRVHGDYGGHEISNRTSIPLDILKLTKPNFEELVDRNIDVAKRLANK